MSYFVYVMYMSFDLKEAKLARNEEKRKAQSGKKNAQLPEERFIESETAGEIHTSTDNDENKPQVEASNASENSFKLKPVFGSLKKSVVKI